MIEFESLAQFEIKGRGTMHVVGNPDLDQDPKRFRDTTVLLDGEPAKVRGVMVPMIHWRPGSTAFATIGLLISDRGRADRPS